MPADNLDDITNLDARRVYAAMAYLSILLVMPWLVRRDDPFVNWHIRQGLLVFVSLIAAIVAAAWVPAIGSVVVLVLLLGNVVALVMALQGRRWRIPFLGLLVEKFSL